MTNNKTPSRQEMIDAIYEKIANKELEFGCWLDSGRNDGYLLDTSRYLVEKTEGKYELYNSYTNNKITDIIKIIGHPVMIGDVMDWFGEKTIDMCWSDSACAIDIREGKNSLDLFHFWKNKRKPIEEQDDNCIEFIYNLISE